MSKRSEYMSAGEDFWLEPDGTWTVCLEPWHSPLKGIPTRELAAQIVDTIDEAMKGYERAFSCCCC